MKSLHRVTGLVSLAVVAALVAMFTFDPVFAASAITYVTDNASTGLGLVMAQPVLAALPESIKAELDKISDKVSAFGDQAALEIKTNAKLSAETREQVDKILTTQGELVADLRAANQAIEKIQSAGGNPGCPKSIGEFVAESDLVKNFNTGIQGQISMKVGNIHAAIDSSGSSAGDLLVPQRVQGIVGIPSQRLFIRDLLNFGTTTASSIEFVRETGFTNNAAPVSENPTNVKPESDIDFEMASAHVATIAHWIRASKQVLEDASQLQAYINGRLIYGLKIKEELQLLKGSGTGLNIHGILPQASAYANPGVFVQDETMIDRLRIALLQVTLAEYEADGIVLNPIDWTTIELTKTDDMAYLFANPKGITGPSLWGRPVVSTPSMDSGAFLVGAFALGAQGWDRENANITISNSDRDNFVKNMVTILAEERVALTVFRPESFVEGSFVGLSS